MNRGRKKWIALLLAAALMLGLVPSFTPSAQAAVTKAMYDVRYQEFIADARWKPGVSWPSTATPKLSLWEATACCAYVADFAAYVYGESRNIESSSGFTKFTNVNDIATGDILHVTEQGGHWLVVLNRSGNTLYTAEGNYNKVVRITNDGWSIKNGQILRNDTQTYTVMDKGYHYNYMDSAVAPVSFSDLERSITIAETNATVAMELNKDPGTKVTEYGAVLYDVWGNELASKVTQASAGLDSTTCVDIVYNINQDMGCTLAKGATYDVVFYAVVDGVTYTCDPYTFATLGQTTYTSYLYYNYSGKNYLAYTDFNTALDTTYYVNQKPENYTITQDSTVKHDSQYGTLKITGKEKGGAWAGMKILALLEGITTNNFIDKSRDLVLSFWAKASVEGASFKVCWAQQNSAECATIPLTTEWAYYSVPMDKTGDYDRCLLTWFDSPGTFWLSELQLEEGHTPTAFAPESQGVNEYFDIAAGSRTLSALATVADQLKTQRDGYAFLGWYDAASGGNKVDERTVFASGKQMLYAHWGEPEYAITTKSNYVNCQVTADQSAAQAGTEVTLTVAAGEDCALKTLTVTGKTSGKAVALTTLEEGSRYSFIMPKEPVTVQGTFTTAGGFVDVVPGSWYQTYVSRAVSYGLFSGTGDGTTFSPDTEMTRAMLVRVLYNHEYALTGEYPATQGKTAFVDVKDGWYKDAVIWAEENGIVKGTDATHFSPDMPLSREMLATMLYRYADQYKGLDVSMRGDLEKYPDANKIGGWARDSVAWGVAQGMLGANATLDPQTTAIRSVAAKILVEYVEKYVVN